MKKRQTLFVLLSSLALLLGGCGDNGGSSSDPAPYTPTPSVVDYKVVVNAHESVSYTLNKERAVKGEEVILTITNIAGGFSIRDVVLNGTTTLTSEDGTTYKFTMPNRSATIVIRVTVSGDITLQGDVVAELHEEEAGSGIYVARNVEVPAGSDRACFSFKVGEVILGALSLDESKSFGDIELTYRGENTFSIARGASYDFYYDVNKVNEAPCYIQRVKVNSLPDSPSSLASVLIDGFAVRSEPAMYPNNLVGITYTKRDTTTSDIYNYTYNWNKYGDDTTFATVRDNFEEKADQYVYRHYNSETDTFQVVDTYSVYVGKKKVNDDRFREDYNSYGPYSGTYSVIDEDGYGKRFAINRGNMEKMLNSSAHMPHFLAETDIMYSYRVGFESDETTSNNIDIQSVATANGFKTTINSYIEYDSTAGTYTSDHHEAYVFAVTLNFDVRGAVTAIDYKKSVFTVDEWDFKNHAPKTGQQGSVKERITASYTYGAPKSEACEFDVSPYFVSSFDALQFVNKNLKDIDTSNGESYIGIKDNLYIMNKEGQICPLVKRLTYSPSTALDLWQYGPTASSNANVIDHLATDLYYQMTSVNEGDAVVTFSSHVDGYGPTAEVKLHVKATSGIRNFYLQDQYDPSYADVESWNSANVRANGVYKFSVGVSSDTAPMVYTAVSDNPTYLKVLSDPNSRDLVIDTTGAKDITEPVEVHVTMNSTRYGSGNSATVFTFYIAPAFSNPVGTWKMMLEDGTLSDDSVIRFTNEAYDLTGKMKGTITDHYIDKYGVDHGTDYFEFWYTYDGSKIQAKVYYMTIETVKTSATPSDMYLEFYYDGKTGNYGVFLAEMTTMEGYDYVIFEDPIFGTTNEAYDEVATYSAFKKVSTSF